MSSRTEPDEGSPRALLVDYGGVLTSSLQECMGAWCEADEVDPALFREVMREWLGPSYLVDAAVNPAHALERGEMQIPDFERELAARLRTRDGRPVPAEGLLTRMFAGFRAEPAMVGVVRRARLAGLRTGLVSNSWGMDYPREDWPEMFDAIVISGEVGMRKPEPQIYEHAARLVGVQPAGCVFVDDLKPNVDGAVAVGMIGVQHRSAEETLAELEAIFGIPLGSSAG